MPLLISASNAQVRQCLDQLLRAARGGELAASKTLASSTLRRKGSSRFFFSCICLQVYYISSKDAYKIRPQSLASRLDLAKIKAPGRESSARFAIVRPSPHARGACRFEKPSQTTLATSFTEALGNLVARARPCNNCLRFDCRLLAVTRVAARPHDVAVDL